MKRIDFEAHFHTKEYLDAMYRNKGYPRFAKDENAKYPRLWYNEGVGQPYVDSLSKSLMDLGEERLARMDRCGVDIQMLSLAAPGLEQLDPSIAAGLARKSNDALFIKRYPGRFIGYAALAPKEPVAAADELERCVKELGFKAWNTHSNFGDSYVDDRHYWPIMERCEKLNVPIYVHPTVPSIPQVRGYGFALTRLQLAELLLDHYPDEKAVALEHLDFAIKDLREMKMQPALERAFKQKEALEA
ncbi:MAG: amidohydrolase family protein [Syntrophorhabdales bacterium]